MFKNRTTAGELLARKLTSYRASDAVVVGLPRGGVVTAAAVANKLRLPLLAVVIKKIVAPHQPELAIGAIGPGRTVYYNLALIKNLGISWQEVMAQKAMAEEKRKIYQQMFQPARIQLKGKTAILVDDGIATGATCFSAIAYLKKRRAATIVLAAPVAHPDVVGELLGLVDAYVILEEPLSLQAVGYYYDEFEPVTDEEVVRLLQSKKQK